METLFVTGLVANEAITVVAEEDNAALAITVGRAIFGRIVQISDAYDMVANLISVFVVAINALAATLYDTELNVALLLLVTVSVFSMGIIPS